MAKKSVKDFLIDWAVIYIKSRDAISKSIVNIETKKDNADVYVTFKDHQLAIIVEPFLKDISFLETLKQFKQKDIKTRLITVNSKANLDIIINEWSAVSSFDREFNIIFASTVFYIFIEITNPTMIN